MDNGNRILNFDLSPKQIKYKDILSKEFIELEIWAISDINPNRNNSHFTVESLRKAVPNVKNKPIVGFFENNDFTTHEGKADYDYELEKEFWNTEKGERILGWVRESDPVEVVEENGLNWLKFRCILCTTYCYKQVKRLLRDKRKKVSVEITVHEHEVIDNIEQIYDFTLNGVTILGSKNGKAVLEGIPDAHLSVLEGLDEGAMMEQKRVLTFAYRQFDAAGSLNEDDIVVEDGTNLDEGNTKKEVNQADMGQVELEKSAEVYATSIKVDKSKEAMSDKPWGEVDKTELRRKVVEADNFKSIADDIFLDLREGWEEGEVSKLKYPVMEIKGDTAVYNRGGLASAKAYAEQHNDEKVLSKLKKIYEDLDLDDSDEEKEQACKMCVECKEDYCYDDDCDDGQDDEHGPDCDCPECQVAHCGDNAQEGETIETIKTEDVVVEHITPDVVVIEQTDTGINEEKPVLSMEETTEFETMDIGIPQCEEYPVEAKVEERVEVVDSEAPAELMPEEGLNVTVADDDNKEEIVVVTEDDYCKLSAECEQLKHNCEELEADKAVLLETIEEKNKKIAEYETVIAGYCDYNDLKQRLNAAEEKLESYRCEELKKWALNLMCDENIKPEFYKEIVDKCCKGMYSCEEDIKKDIAIAIYTSRPNQERRFSVSIPVSDESGKEQKKRKLTPAEGIRQYLGK